MTEKRKPGPAPTITGPGEMIRAKVPTAIAQLCERVGRGNVSEGVRTLIELGAEACRAGIPPERLAAAISDARKLAEVVAALGQPQATSGAAVLRPGDSVDALAQQGHRVIASESGIVVLSHDARALLAVNRSELRLCTEHASRTVPLTLADLTTICEVAELALHQGRRTFDWDAGEHRGDPTVRCELPGGEAFSVTSGDGFGRIALGGLVLEVQPLALFQLAAELRGLVSRSVADEILQRHHLEGMLRSTPQQQGQEVER